MKLIYHIICVMIGFDNNVKSVFKPIKDEILTAKLSSAGSVQIS